jgi:hypothetical protein
MIDDKTGRRYERLVATRLAPGPGPLRWECRCDCGATTVVRATNLQQRRTRSCGCLATELRAGHVKHGHNRKGRRSATYTSWALMTSRCYDPGNPNFASYGGRGIAVCPQWRGSFEQFLADMGARPKGMTIDRIDNNGNYEPGNCRWATGSEQSLNRSNTVMVAMPDGTRMPLWLAAQQAGLKPMTVHARRHRGVPEKRWFEPVGARA